VNFINSTFISDVAQHLLTHHAEHLGQCTVVFPNRRAGLFLKKELSKKISQPVWSPEVVSLEDFLLVFSSIKKTDTLTLIFELYEAFIQHQPKAESFETFYFWGEMLLRDFEEVDHYLVQPKQLFHYIKSDRQIAEDFYFLSPEQEKIIRSFWEKFFPTASKSQQQFMETWRILLPVYESFQQQLLQKQIGYTSMIYRHLADTPDVQLPKSSGPIIFAGFNALTPAEEALIKYFVLDHQAEILWDVDDYYVRDERQEAGRFLRKYQKDITLGKTFSGELPQRITQPKEINVTGVSLEIGQAKAIGEKVKTLLDKGEKHEDIVIVLPQDYMLFPVLNALPENVQKLNVTMGYPLKDTPLFGLLEAALEVVEHAHMSADNGLSFYHKPTLDVLSHPYLYQKDRSVLDTFIKDVRDQNMVRIFQSEIKELKLELLDVIFRVPKQGESLASYLFRIVEMLGKDVVERYQIEREYLYHFQQLLGRLETILGHQSVEVDLKTFKGLFRKASRSVKIPFSGEPVEGLQIMGVLETRNLDFKHVFMLNMNEDIFPSSQRLGSFIPYHIRKAFGLPTFEVQDSIYAYLFYRLLQRAGHLDFYYNMYADFGLSGEVSRFVRQLELESGLTVSRFKLSNPIQVREHPGILVEKTPEILNKLNKYTETGHSKLSASALNVYFECRLKFYFKYVLELFAKGDIQEELIQRDFGTVLHHAIELLYKDAVENRPNRIVEPNDFFKMKNSVDGAIAKAFREHYGLGGKRKFELQGRNLVMADVMKKFVHKILELDEAYAPFEIVSLEDEDKYLRIFTVNTSSQQWKIRLGADIDRVDRKGTTVRVLDYKSGRDKRNIDNLPTLFDREFSKRNKAGFQTMLYAWLYAGKHGTTHTITPGLFNIHELFQDGFTPTLIVEGEPLTDARPHLEWFEQQLSALLSEVFSLEQPFDQTTDLKKCGYCDFKNMCGR
jgi:hypothetical protein